MFPCTPLSTHSLALIVEVRVRRLGRHFVYSARFSIPPYYENVPLATQPPWSVSLLLGHEGTSMVLGHWWADRLIDLALLDS